MYPKSGFLAILVRFQLLLGFNSLGNRRFQSLSPGLESSFNPLKLLFPDVEGRRIGLWSDILKGKMKEVDLNPSTEKDC